MINFVLFHSLWPTMNTNRHPFLAELKNMKNINTNLPSESRKTPSVKLSKIKSSVVLAPELIKPRKSKYY